MKGSAGVLGSLLLVLTAGCNVRLSGDPLDPLNGILNSIEDAQKSFEENIEDPFDVGLYPVLVGGDSERIFYATSLTDVRVRIPGPINDVVLPSFIGPSNLYRYADKRRELIRPLIPSGAFSGIATDGRFLVYTSIPDFNSDSPQSKLIASDYSILDSWVLFESSAENSQLSGYANKVDAGRVAYVVAHFDESGAGRDHESLVVQNLDGSGDAQTIEADFFGPFDLRSHWLIYDAQQGGVRRVVLRDLRSGFETILSASPAAPVAVTLAGNHAVWGESIEYGIQRIFAVELATGEQRTWADAVDGYLTGATDTHFLMEVAPQADRNSGARILIRSHGVDGSVKQLDAFDADGLAGQSRVLGNRAVWVKPNRRVVTALLSGGERSSFAPY